MSAPVIAIARQNDRLDQLVWRTTGGGPATVEATLEANPGLSELGVLLPQGTEVAIPSTPEAEPVALIQLWS